jgi:hypothetical protein
MNISSNHNNQLNQNENTINNCKKILLVNKKVNTIQSRNTSHLLFPDNQSTLRKTFSNEGKMNILTHSNGFFNRNIKNNDSIRNFANSLEKGNLTVKDKEIDFSKFKTQQQKYSEIYYNNLNSSIAIHSKSRNTNDKVSEKLPFSQSVNLPRKKNHNNLVLTKTINQKSSQSIQSKFGEKSFSDLKKKEVQKTNSMINNYLHNKNLVNKHISLKKPLYLIHLSNRVIN